MDDASRDGMTTSVFAYLFADPPNTGEGQSRLPPSLSEGEDVRHSGGAAISAAHSTHAVDASEQVLVQRIAAGDEHAFDQVYLEYFAALAGFATSYVHDADIADDIVQDVFRRLWEQRSAFAPRGTIRAYLYGAVRNGAFNYRRHERVTQRNAEQSMQSANASGVGEQPLAPDTTLQIRDALAEVTRVLAALPEDRRRLVSLRWQHQLSYTDIAEVLGISEQVARTQVSRIARQLRDIVREAM